MAVDFVTQPTETKDSFAHFWSQHGEWVEEPNQRRGGESGVQRVIGTKGQLLYIKRQIGHTYRSWLHPLGRPTVLRERDALRELSLLQVGVPELVFAGARRSDDGQWQALLVTASLDGYMDIESWYTAGERERIGEAVHERLLATLATTLARMHQGRWQHGCLYAKHVFVKVASDGVEVALLDLEKSRRRLSRQRAARHDLRQLRRHSPWSDGDWQLLLQGYRQQWGRELPPLG